LRYRYTEKYKNINLFPFCAVQLRVALRSDLLLAYDELPRNPCSFGGVDFHHSALLLSPGSSLERGPQDVITLLQPTPYAALLDQMRLCTCSVVSVEDLVPFIFPAYFLGK